MARGVKIDNQKIAEIVTSYALTNNYNKTAKETGVCANSVKNIITKQKLENYAEFEKVCKDKKETFYNMADNIVYKALNKLDKLLDEEKIAANHLTTVIGTLYDKMRLEKGESTENNRFEIKVEVIK